ncbi:TIGR01666 family membrane protein [Photobacterium damselae subsp. piscicida]|uniref:Inner membrane protein YccS n=1 Tax=Photobacterium damsela subsp. piscicida TaxID=38294 RepID=A0A1Q9H487_PHODP|nr:YccS family putative transporter [Photobacterium damselae]MBE8128871.1 TIGR01666 family membrane protein [Photobacterium damselae subsp. piscicida]OLQ82610.1 TIGR01666 family membrane protein [Photobacterium damselae subsp. piscicida]PSV76738.1 TIGR01666 family membrane protein [Photobacterium damselae]PSW80818.1 TIGR01666 family membrane protein [Photobacterium damselae]QOD53561.1 TIGR01666 family membrane protein [Photobacterium damselae subsp. piscicida]
MQTRHLHFTLRRYWANDRINYCIRVLIAMIGVVFPCWYLNATSEVTPLILGIIAAALAETDDNLTGRLKALATTLICFLVASVSIEVLFDYPILFALGLFSSTFGFIMLGAMGPRYASIAFASLLLAVYTMLGADSSVNLWYQPMLLLGGAFWYGLLSLMWHILWPNQPVQQNLAHVFSQLATYLDSKSQLFEPIADLQPQPLRLDAAHNNAKVVAALNGAKATLLHRARRGQPHTTGDRFLKIYFMAQDIHERVSSSHYRYQDLAATFQRSDVLFRFQRLLRAQAMACRDIAKALAIGKPYQHLEITEKTLDELRESINYLKAQNNPQWRLLLTQLDYLFSNLATVERQLANISNPDATVTDETELADNEAHSIPDLWRRITSQLNPQSLLFRHALRMAIALTVGYGCIQFLHLERGYWILLTTLFVCQPNYSATRQKLVQRVIGTLGGLLAGIPLLYLFPGQEGQLVLMILAGVLFFAFRMVRYDLATAFITLLVLFCFNQLGEGFAVILPRLGDTLLGCFLAVIAVSYILPDWESHRLHKVMANSINANREYLGQIIAQYRLGKRDCLNYRVARRNAHNTDAQLSTAISNMLAEPRRYRMATNESFRFLTLNHAMLSYISALGAHRTQLEDNETYHLVSQAYRSINEHLESLTLQLEQNKPMAMPETDSALEQSLSQWRDDDCESTKMVLQQLHLIQRMLPELHSLTNKLTVRTNISK